MWGMAIMAGLKAVGGIAKSIKGNADKRKAMEANEKAKAEMDKAMDKYRNMDTSNPYLNMENTMEDLTVNTQAADMANEQNQAGMANTLSNMNQAAGGSGIAALAQAMANQCQIANQKASVSIADQEKANQSAERQEAGRIQDLERKGELQSRKLKSQIAAMEVKLAAGDVAGTAADIEKGQQAFAEGLDDVAGAGGSYVASKNYGLGG